MVTSAAFLALRKFKHVRGSIIMHYDWTLCICLPASGNSRQMPFRYSFKSRSALTLYVEIGHIAITMGGCGAHRARLMLRQPAATPESVLASGIGNLFKLLQRLLAYI